MTKNESKLILKTIKKFDTIVIARHVGPDPDALCSQMALKELILKRFPKKKVYAVGKPAKRLAFIGELDKDVEVNKEESLLIVLDTPDKKRIDEYGYYNYNTILKIDHHPLVDDFGGIEIIDSASCSTCQLILEFAFNMKLDIDESIANKLYMGVVSDTDRFLHGYTSAKTFELISKLLRETNIKFTSLYENLYLRPLVEIRFQGYILQNIVVTENKFGYIKLTTEIIKEFGVDPGSAGNMVDKLNFIDEIVAWAVFSEDEKFNTIRCSIRSRGPIVNEVAANYNGGGHIYAAGARVSDFDEVDKLVYELDKVCEDYIK